MKNNEPYDPSRYQKEKIRPLAYQETYYVANRERILANRRAYYKANKEKALPPGQYIGHCGIMQKITQLPHVCAYCSRQLFITEEATHGD